MPSSTVGPRSCSPVLAVSRHPRSHAPWGVMPKPSAMLSRHLILEALRRCARAPPAPHRFRVAFDLGRGEQLRARLHQSPRAFGKPTSVWTLELAADVSFERGLTPARVSGETIRATLERLGIRWQRAKRWITSPDPGYARKKARAIA